MPSLHWTGKDAAVVAVRNVPYRPLVEMPSLSYGDPDTENLLIQGDNLDALKSLLPVYAGRVKCIFIDPPYNTRSAFEHYDDNREHSIWLSMMYPRLELLRELLREDGSIWVTIDDNEGHYLKVIMDEVFGRGNFSTSFIWQKVDSPNDNKVPITPDHEFVLCYEKTKDGAGFRKMENSSLLDAYSQKDENGRLCRDRLLKKNGKSSFRTDRPSMFFQLDAPDGTPVFPIHDDGREARWSHSLIGIKKAKSEGRLIWKKRDKDGRAMWIPYIREYAPETPTRPHPTILLDVKTSRQAKAHQRELLPDAQAFDTVKPEQLIKRIFEIATSPGDLVLDSFLGSGTTAAVAHKMGRSWIGVEMGEQAETHCAARLRKVIDGEQGGVSKEVNWQGGGGFRFCQLGEAVFDGHGSIRPAVGFADLARWIWYRETRQPLSDAPETPLLGVHEGTAYYLLFNGILGDRRPESGNVLTAPLLDGLPPHDGPRVVFGEACRLHESRLAALNLRFRQLPYQANA